MENARSPDIRCVVVRAVANSCNLDETAIQDEADLLKVGMDSLAVMGLIAEMQASIGQELSDGQKQEIFNAETIGELMRIFKSAAGTADR